MDWFGVWFWAGFGLVLSGHWIVAAIQTWQVVKQRAYTQRTAMKEAPQAGAGVSLFNKAKRIRYGEEDGMTELSHKCIHAAAPMTLSKQANKGPGNEIAN